VRAYPDEKQVETSLIHGKVEVSLVSKPEKIFYLKPAEKLVLRNVEPETEKQEAIRKIKGLERVVEMIPQFTTISYDPIDSLPIETAWVNNQLAFVEESFARLAEKMEKWYGVSIVFDNPQLESLRFTGKFEKESLREALEALRIIGKFQFTINQNTVIIFNTKN
jgi:alpha-L-fucosidase